MNNKVSIILALFIATHPLAAQQGVSKVAEKFFVYLNADLQDSLKILLADDFEIRATYQSPVYNKTLFFSNYVKNYKAYNTRSEIINTYSLSQSEVLTVKEQREYDNLLNLNSPNKIFTFKIRGVQIVEIIADTTDGASNFFRQLKQKTDKFFKWWDSMYPNETAEELHEKDGLLLTRLREFSKTSL